MAAPGAAAAAAAAESGEGEGEHTPAELQRANRQLRAMMQEEERMSIKLMELEREVNDHRRVSEQMSTMDGERKCYRRVGDVLVEGSVSTILPEVEKAREMIEKLLEQLKKDLRDKAKARLAFQTKYRLQPTRG